MEIAPWIGRVAAFLLGIIKLTMSDVPNLQVPTISIAHSNARFPVRRIFCVGQNYADRAREMGSDPNRQPPGALRTSSRFFQPTSQSLRVI
jgi:2-keto-4-pentenoate hydratase/2-oxohepta-3-ene-1,7-dioic acid hydratase in catechol pathway